MATVDMTIPETASGILAARENRYVCPRCDDDSREGGGITATGNLGSPFGRPEKARCSYCHGIGQVSYEAFFAAVGTEPEIANLFRLIRQAILQETPQGYDTALRLLGLALAIHEAAKRIQDEQLPCASEQVLAQIVEHCRERKASRTESFHAGMAAIQGIAEKKLVEYAERIAEGCTLCREALDAQRAIEDKFDQPY